jgi:hypothetical protein
MLETRQLVHQTVGANCAPVSGADVFNDALNDFAARFFLDQDLIGVLVGADIRQAEIQDVPAKADVGGLDLFFLAGGGAEIRRVIDEIEA